MAVVDGYSEHDIISADFSISLETFGISIAVQYCLSLI